MEIPFFSRKSVEKSGAVLNKDTVNQSLEEKVKGISSFTDPWANLSSFDSGLDEKDKALLKKIKPVKQNYDKLTTCYKYIPKVFRAVNTRANFAVQSGYRLVGKESDITAIRKWENKVHFDNYLIQIVKEAILYGNVFVYPYGDRQSTELKFLPPGTMRVLKDESGIILGYVQIVNRKIVAKWAPDELVHFKWNVLSGEDYGISEVSTVLNMLEKKVDIEKKINSILESQLLPKVIHRCGTPEKPFSTTQMTSFKAAIEDKDAGSDLLVPGDVDPVVVQAQKGGFDNVMGIMEHVESQVDTGLNFPEILIAGRADAQGSMIQMDSLERDVKTLQDFLTSPVQRYIYTKVLGSKDTPYISWNPMNIETALRTSRTLRQLVGDGKAPAIITVDEAREELGLVEMSDEQKKEIKDLAVTMNPIPFSPDGGPSKPFGDKVEPKQKPKPFAGAEDGDD